MTRTKTVSRERYTVFWNRAKQYHDSMGESFARGAYDACISHAVHCAISSLDSVSVRLIGKKSSAQNHNEIVLLLKEEKTSQESEKSRVIDATLRLIDMKSVAEYEDRAMSKADAEKAVVLCNKVHSFAEKEIENG
mgnify:CR=1 FL=1